MTQSDEVIEDLHAALAECEQVCTQLRQQAAIDTAALNRIKAERHALRKAIEAAITELDGGFVGSRYRLKPIIDRLRAALAGQASP